MGTPAPLPRRGILYAEDFEIAVPRAAAIPLAPALLTEESLRRSRAEGRAEGIEAAKTEQAQIDEQLRTAALQAIGDQLNQAGALWARRAEAHATALARSLLGMLAAALPALCARHAESEISAVMAVLLPGLAEEPKAQVRVNPALLAFLTGALAQAGAANRIDISADRDLPPGDLRIDWGGGRATRDTTALWQSIREALLPLDLPALMEE